MTQTTYYEFNKPEGTDLVNPLVDTNPNWDALDAYLHDFNLRSIANCTEVVSLGVHAISRLDTTSKFLKWIATANFTAGDTFVVDGNAVAAATPSGAALATDAYVTGAVILACLNSDNTAMTIYVTGSNVAADSARLGGELPSYYATDSDMTAAETDITNIQALQGTTAIVGIGDGTLTGAVSSLNQHLTVNTFGATVDISSHSVSDLYEFPSDGYVRLDVSYTVPATRFAYVYDNTGSGNPAIISATSTSQSSTNNSLFVKKGMKVGLTSTGSGVSMYFLPLE